MKNIAVYCGANKGTSPAFINKAIELGRVLAERKINLVYGGGRIGLMGTIADSVLRFGGHVIGVIPEKLDIKEVVHANLPDLWVVKSMHERKALMAELADGFIAMPGGFGTFEEFFEVLTWTQLGFHKKPVGLLNVNQFYTPMLTFLDSTVEAGFIKASHRKLIAVDEDPATLVDKLHVAPTQAEAKWDHLTK